MITEDRKDEIVESVLHNVHHTLTVKAKEYVRDKNDPLHNFRKGAEKINSTVEDVLWNRYALKHLVSLEDLIEEQSTDIDLVTEKITDLLCYLVLLQVCFEERYYQETIDEYNKRIKEPNA